MNVPIFDKFLLGFNSTFPFSRFGGNTLDLMDLLQDCQESQDPVGAFSQSVLCAMGEWCPYSQQENGLAYMLELFAKHVEQARQHINQGGIVNNALIQRPSLLNIDMRDSWAVIDRLDVLLPQRRINASTTMRMIIEGIEKPPTARTRQYIIDAFFIQNQLDSKYFQEHSDKPDLFLNTYTLLERAIEYAFDSLFEAGIYNAGANELMYEFNRRVGALGCSLKARIHYDTMRLVQYQQKSTPYANYQPSAQPARAASRTVSP